MSATTIAAIIPVRNRPELVLEALTSVAAQTRPPDLLVVIDDGSTDNTAAAVERWLATQYSARVSKLTRQPHGGCGAACNRGAAEASGCRWLAFLDSDDLWPPDYLARMLQALAPADAEDAGTVAATCDQRALDMATGRAELRPHDWVAPHTTAALLRHGPPGTPNTVFRADAFREAGGYDPRFSYGLDYHLMLKLSLRGRWLHVPGEPVTVRKKVRTARGEADQLSATVTDRRLQMAQQLQRFIDEDGGREAVPARIWRRRLSRQWVHAGRQLASLGRQAEAADCFRRAVAINPWSPAARWSAFTVR